jgi:hypothetical protein
MTAFSVEIFTDDDGQRYSHVIDRSNDPDITEVGIEECQLCHRRVFRDNMQTIYRRDAPPLSVCLDCAESIEYTTCAGCGASLITAPERLREVAYIEDTDSYNIHYYCQDCANNLTRCPNCGEYFDDDIYDGECPWCGHSINGNPLEGYHWTPSLYHLPTYDPAELYYGVELEIDGGGEDRDNAFEILQAAKSTEGRRLTHRHVWITHDGSLTEGMEIISQPATLEYHLHSFPWPAITERARDLGYRSHDAGTCGLHIHASYLPLAPTELERDMVLAKILLFYERNWSDIVKFSRRTYRQIHDFACRYGYETDEDRAYMYSTGGIRLEGYPDDASKLYKYALSSGARYTAVNLCPMRRNSPTIEFRIFRGTLNVSTIFATLQFTNALIKACQKWTITEANDAKISDLLGFAQGARLPRKEFFEYCVKRNMTETEEN